MELADTEFEIDEDYDEYDNEDTFYDDGDGLVPPPIEEEPEKGGHGCLVAGIITALALIAVIVLFMTVDDGFIGTYKQNFSNNFTRLFGNWVGGVRTEEAPKAASANNKQIKSSTLISLDNPDNAVFAVYKQGILCASSNHMSYTDKQGNLIWETDTAIVEPILSAEGNYILIAEKGRRKLCLYSDKNLVYDTDDPDNIVAAKVSTRGDVVAVTDKSSYRGGISVYNKDGQQVYSWASGHDTVISADISASSRRVAVALLNTDSNAKSIIQFFDLNVESSYSQAEIINTVVYGLQFTGNTLTAFGDNRLCVFSDSGDLVANNELSDVQITHSAIDDKGNTLLSIDSGNTPVLNLYSPKGALKETMGLGGVVSFIDIDGKNVLYSIGRDIYFGRINAKKIAKYTATMDIRRLLLLSDNTFVVVYSNSLEVITV